VSDGASNQKGSKSKGGDSEVRQGRFFISGIHQFMFSKKAMKNTWRRVRYLKCVTEKNKTQ